MTPAHAPATRLLLLGALLREALCRPLLLVGHAGAALALLIVCPAHAAAGGVPHGSSIDATRQVVERTLGLVRKQAPVLDSGRLAVPPLAACDRWSQSLCSAPDAQRCVDALAATFDALAPDHASAPPADETSTADGARRSLSLEVAGALSRLAWVAAADPPAGCGNTAPPAPVPAELVLHADGRTFDLRPLVPLRAGERWALVAPDLSSPRRQTLAAALDAGSAFALEAESTATRLDDGVDARALRDLLARMNAAAPPAGQTGVLSGVRGRWPERLRGADVAALRAAFVVVPDAAPGEAIATIDVVDPARGLARPSGPCRPLRTTAADPPAFLGGQAPVTGFEEEVPFLLALPPAVDASTALVLGVDGHLGSARRMMERHRAGLRERGLALLTVDLPLHGARARPEADFIDVLDPIQFTTHFRRSIEEILSIAADARGCGFELPGGRRWKPARVLYLGYSLGSLVGTAVRALDRELGPAVLLAPGGDLFSWLFLQISPRLQMPFVGCAGGPEDGDTCHDDGLCAPPGQCIVAPLHQAVGRLLERPYGQATLGAEPLAFASRRDSGSDAPLLLVAGGEDPVFHPTLVHRLADAYVMRPVGSGVLRGPRSTLVVWPHLLHDLDRPDVHAQAYDFLETGGRVRPVPAAGAIPARPAWYEIYQPQRR